MQPSSRLISTTELCPAVQTGDAEHFYKLLVEVVGVELSLLLHDATQPDNLVPSTAADSAVPMAARSKEEAEAATSEMQDVRYGEVEEMGTGPSTESQEGGGDAPLQGDPSQPSRVTAEDVDAAAQRWQDNVGSTKGPRAEVGARTAESVGQEKGCLA
jgi:hypothetical protein